VKLSRRWRTFAWLIAGLLAVLSTAVAIFIYELDLDLDFDFDVAGDELEPTDSELLREAAASGDVGELWRLADSVGPPALPDALALAVLSMETEIYEWRMVIG